MAAMSTETRRNISITV